MAHSQDKTYTFSIHFTNVPCSIATYHSVNTLSNTEYHSLDKQLDQLADYLTVMEGRSDRLAEEARQLLQEAREARTVATSNGVESTQNRRNQS